MTDKVGHGRSSESGKGSGESGDSVFERFPLGSKVTTEELRTHPHPVLHRLRSREPLSWIPELRRWLVTDWSLALEILRDWQRFTVDDARFTTGQVVGPSMLSRDGVEHGRHRRPFDPHFRLGAVTERAARTTAWLARELMDDLESRGGGELRTELAAPLAVVTIAEYLGLDRLEPDRNRLIHQVLGWYQHIVAAVEALTTGESPSLLAAEAMDRMGAVVDLVLGTKDDDHDITTMLIEVARSATLSRDELVSNVAVVLFGAIETSEAMTANALWHLLTHPEAVEIGLTGGNRGRFIARAVEESLRLEPAATMVDRYTTQDLTIGGIDLVAGEAVAVSLAGANRDPAVFEDPDRFHPGRPGVERHLAFVRGPHACLGLHLARLQTRHAVEQVLDRWHRMRFVPNRSHGPSGLVFRKVGAVTVSIEGAGVER